MTLNLYTMKKRQACLRLTSLLMLLTVCGCQQDGTLPGEACSIAQPGITFARSLNHAHAQTTVADGKLMMTSEAKTDYFNEPDGKAKAGNAPVLLAAVDNQKPFTFTTRVTPVFTETYDAGAVYVYVDQDWWLKFAFEQDERKNTRIVTVRTRDTSDDNNHDVIAGHSSVYLKVSSDTHTVAFYYSTDNVNWQLVRLFKNDFPENLWLGISAQSPIAQGNQATFESTTLTFQSVQDFRLGI